LREWWLSLPGTPVEKLTVEMLLSQIDHDKAQIGRLDLIIAQELMTDDRAPFLLQTSGVGVLGAMKILGAIGVIERFPTPEQLVGYAGLGARVHDSGQRKVQGAITKFGRVDLRSAMVMAARHARIVNKHWKEVYRRLEPRLGRNKAIVAVARQMLVAVWHVGHYPAAASSPRERANADRVGLWAFHRPLVCLTSARRLRRRVGI
jgi:transposase